MTTLLIIESSAMKILDCTLSNLGRHNGKYIFYFDYGKLGNVVQYDVGVYNIMARYVGGYFIPLSTYPSKSALELLLSISCLFLEMRLNQQLLDSKITALRKLTP